jgi:hypothetical protein
LYDYRVHLGLEHKPAESIVLDLTQCSEATQTATAPIQELLDAGKAATAYDDVMDDWFQMVLDFINCGDSPCGHGLI